MEKAMKATTLRYEAYAANEAAEKAARYAKRAVVACAAPFLGLAFVVAMPFAGIAALAWMGAKAFAAAYPRAARALKNAALFLAAPFIGLAYALAFPFVGVGVIAWAALKKNA
jgi:hypothetical protein